MRIHTEAWCLRNFNPRSYKRSDLFVFAHFLFLPKFQSTLLQEERPARICIMPPFPLQFQSTLLQEERRLWQQILPRWMDYFNPRSYKRSDLDRSNSFSYRHLFQSTLLQEERHLLLSPGMHPKIFQSTLLQEERRQQIDTSTPYGKFQSTLLQEERRKRFST